MNGLNEYKSINEGIRETYGEDVSVIRTHYVGGGDINEARCLELSNGEKLFVKMNRASNAGFFEAEAIGLNAISSTGAIRTPKLLFYGVDDGSDKTSGSSGSAGKAFLAMEYISEADRIDGFWETFGHELAAMHLARTDGHFIASNDNSEISNKYGFKSNNYIGATKQINDVRETWIDFFRECRLEPQYRMAEHYFRSIGSSITKDFLKLLDKLPELLIEPKAPSLLHGDLWSGNYIVGNDGKAWLIDPAVYVGHAEADLAMTELFGRFPSSFYSAYAEVNPIEPGYNERRNLYNLYHLLNHLNLFGETYLSAVITTIRQI